jgi:hypothetical protein
MDFDPTSPPGGSHGRGPPSREPNVARPADRGRLVGVGARCSAGLHWVLVLCHFGLLVTSGRSSMFRGRHSSDGRSFTAVARWIRVCLALQGLPYFL